MITLSETVNIWYERKMVARLGTPETVNRFTLSPNKKMLAIGYGYEECECSDDFR